VAARGKQQPLNASPGCRWLLFSRGLTNPLGLRVPWEETDEYIRSGHRSPEDFQEGSFRTITIDADKGIKAVIGKPKGKDTTEVQSYLFDKDKWTLEEAKAWFEEHKSETLKIYCGLPLTLKFLTEKADPNAKIFPWSMPARYYMKPGRMIIYGTALVAGQTRKGDVYTVEELRRAARSLVGGPIEFGEHSWDVGEPRWLPYPDNVILDAEEVNGRLEYIAGVSDPKIQELIRNGEITGVSINAICRYVPADNPGLCNGMILNGFCLLPKTALPASVGTCVKVWNSFRADALRLRSVGKPCLPENGVSKSMTEKKKEGKTAQATQPPITGHGPVAGVPEPSIEDRVAALEAGLEELKTFVTTEFTAINAKLDTLIKTEPAPSVVVPAAVTAAKKTEQEWTREYINDLPDECFAFIEPGGEKDEQGKTVPRSLRHLPYKNAQGNIDPEHLRNALARLPQTDLSEEAKAKAKKKLCGAVREWNEQHPDNPIESDVCEVHPEQKTEQQPKKKTEQEPGEGPPEQPPKEGQPKTDRERFMAHYGLTEEQMAQVLEWIGEDVYKLLPERGQKVKTEQMSVEEIKARIKELSKQKEDLVQKLYPEPPEISEEQRTEIQAQIDAISAEMEALEKVLAERLAEGQGETATQTENVVANFKPVENEPAQVFLTEQEILDVFRNKRFFTPALQANAILALLEEKRREVEQNA